MGTASLAGRAILVVEDHPLIAIEIVDAFERAGAVALSAKFIADARHFIEEDGLSAAVLSFRPDDDDADELCAKLGERNVPFVIHSGYNHEAHQRGVVIPKPASPNALVDTIAGLLNGKGTSCQ